MRAYYTQCYYRQNPQTQNQSSSNGFTGGQIQRAYNNNGQNYTQNTLYNRRSGNVNIFNSNDITKYQAGHDLKKVNCISANGETTSLIQDSGNTYNVTGELAKDFSPGKPSSYYNTPTQTNLGQADADKKAQIGSVMCRADANSTTEVSNGEYYDTETFFQGKNGTTIGIGARTKDNRNAEKANNELKEHMNKFKERDLAEMQQLAGGSDSDAGKAFQKFKDTMFKTNKDGTLTPKDFNEENAGGAAKTVREVAQELNKALRTKAGTNEHQLNKALTNMVQADAELRDIAEGAKNNFKKNSNADILRLFAGSKEQLMQQCQTEGARQGAQDGAFIGAKIGAEIGATKGWGGPITQMAMNRGAQLGSQRGANEGNWKGWQSGGKVGNGLNAAIYISSGLKVDTTLLPKSIQQDCATFMSDESNLSDKNKCLDMGIRIAQATEEAAQAERAQAYTNNGCPEPKQTPNPQIQKLIQGMENLKAMPDGVSEAIADLPVDKAKNVMAQLSANKNSPIKQATILAKECPEGLSAALENAIDQLGTELNIPNPQSGTGYNLFEDLQENGQELFEAIKDKPEIITGALDKLTEKIKNDENIKNQINKFVDKIDIDNLNSLIASPESSFDKKELLNQIKDYVKGNNDILNSLLSLGDAVYRSLSPENKTKIDNISFLKNLIKAREAVQDIAATSRNVFSEANNLLSNVIALLKGKKNSSETTSSESSPQDAPSEKESTDDDSEFF